MTITLAEVHARLEIIRRFTGNDEVSHIAEDALWKDVLIVIAEGAPNAEDLARAALETQQIDFSRWYA